jgi:hypothetical protein
LSTVVPTSFVAVDSLDKTRFRFIAGHRVDYRFGEQTQEGKSDVLPFDLFAQHLTGIVVLSTVVPTSFAAVDSLDKTRFRFIAGHRVDYRCGEQTQEGKSDVLPFDLFARH